MNTDTNLKNFQNYLKEKGIDFALIFSNDEFLKECSDLNMNSRYLISGFTGTAGDMLVSQNNAFIFVDGRYHIQVDEQTNSKTIAPVKLQMGETRNEKIFEIIKKSNIKNPKISFNTKKISCNGFNKLEKLLKKLNAEFIKQDEDYICKHFAIKSDKHVYHVWKLGIKITGKSVTEKLKGLKKYENDFLLLFSNDEICYLANIRSNQNPNSSSLDAFALANRNVMHIFTDKKYVPLEIKNSKKNVIFHNFDEFNGFIQKIQETIYYEPEKTPLFYTEKLKEKNLILKKISKNPVALMKSVKNKAELNYIKNCYKISDETLFKTLTELNNQIISGEKMSAGEFTGKIINDQKKAGVVELSFTPIFAINERSAIIHCTEFDKNYILKKGDLILLDFGVYFEGGYATDMTRTFVIGEKYSNILIKKVYTTVLKAFLNTLNIKITKDTTYFDLDKKARDIIKKAKIKGFNFNHGTGHGIGLNVHEMPPVLSPSKLAQKHLRANNIFSIEPGMYKENIGGVRLENSVYTVKTKEGLKIKTLTNLPFDEKLIMFEMLNQKEQKWFKNYMENAIK